MAGMIDYNWLESKAGLQSQKLSFEESLAGNTLVSAETNADIAPSTVESAIIQSPETFMRYIRFLSPLQQEVLLGYYFLSKTQTDLAKAKVGDVSQTLVSQCIKQALRTLSYHVVCGGIPSEGHMSKVLTPLNLEMGDPTSKSQSVNRLSVPLSKVVYDLSMTRSYDKTTIRLGVARPALLRRALLHTLNILNGNTDENSQMLHAYITSAHDRATDKPHKAHNEVMSAPLLLRTPAVLGQFRVRAEDPGFDQIFTSKNLTKGTVED